MPAAPNDNYVTADGRQKNRMEAYTKFWQDDLNKEKEVDTENRLSSYTDVVNGTSRAMQILKIANLRLSPSRLL